MFKFKLYPVILLILLSGITTNPIHAAQLSQDKCYSFASPTCSDESLQKNWISLAWGDLFKWLRRQRGAKGIRRPDANPRSFYCLIAPGKLENKDDFQKSTTARVWSRKPLFVWQGIMSQIQVYAHGEAEPLWTKALDEDDHSIVYDGETPLTPNSLGYYWQVQVKYPETEEDPKNPGKVKKLNEFPRMSFKVMADAPAEELHKQLQEIDQQDLSPVEKANRRIAIFREERFGGRNKSALTGDILRELYSLETPPPELAMFKDQDFCSDEENGVVTS